MIKDESQCQAVRPRAALKRSGAAYCQARRLQPAGPAPKMEAAAKQVGKMAMQRQGHDSSARPRSKPATRSGGHPFPIATSASTTAR